MRGFTYQQSTGTLAVVNGDWFAPLFVGSAGREAGRNSPDHQCEKNVGPLPVGDYRMRIVDHPRFKAPAIRLYPLAWSEEGTLDHMCGRSGFFIHGGTVSQGCILLQQRERSAVSGLVEAGFTVLRVVP